MRDIDFPSLVRSLRTELNLTQEQLAHQLDVTFATVNAWENGRHRPIRSLGRRLLELAATAGVKVPTDPDRGGSN